MIVCINGSRGLHNIKLVYAAMERAAKQGIVPSVIISGGASGVDTLAYQYANENQIEFQEFRADWKKHGKSAGYIRNDEMLGELDALVSVWDGQSRGTKHLVDLAYRNEKRVCVYLKTLHVVRVTGHPFILPERIYDEYTAIKVHDIGFNIDDFPTVVRDSDTKVAVIVPNIRYKHAVLKHVPEKKRACAEANWRHFAQRMQDKTNIDMRF
jgi:hypothetical protein